MRVVTDKKILCEQRKSLLQELDWTETNWETGYWKLTRKEKELDKRARKQLGRLFAAARKAIRSVKP